MSNINKILITVVACVFMVCIASVSIVSIVTSNRKETTTTTAPALQQDDNAEKEASTSSAPVSTAAPEVNQQTSTQKPQADSSTTTTQPSATQPSTATPEVTGNLATDILGSWKDSAGMSGYEFLEGGRFNWTYVDLAGFGVPFNGKTSGLYTLEGDTLTIKYSIYSATIKKTYRISIDQNELSMYDLEEKETSTYVRTVTQ